MASGCPCLVADTGGLREVVPHEEVGLRFRSRDPESLAEVAMRVLADDELGRRLVAEAYEHVRSFDWADVAEQTAGRLRAPDRRGATGSDMTPGEAAELAFAGAARQADMLRAGEVSPRELVELYLDRIERLDPQLNAFRVVMARAR